MLNYISRILRHYNKMWQIMFLSNKFKTEHKMMNCYEVLMEYRVVWDFFYFSANAFVFDVLNIV